MSKLHILSFVTFCLATTSVVYANNDNTTPLIVSLWHTWVNPSGNTIFWDSNAAPILEDSPEFLHTRLAAPTGAAYEIDVTANTMSLKVSDLSGVSLTEMPDGQADRYYLFVDATAQLTSAKLAASVPAGVKVQIVPRGTEIIAQDKSYPLDLDLELDQDAVMIELGPGTPLQDDSLSIVVNYVRVAATVLPSTTSASEQVLMEGRTEGRIEDASSSSVSWFTSSCAAASLFMAWCLASIL